MEITEEVSGILAEDTRRTAEMEGHFNPITGRNSIGVRERVTVGDYLIEEMWLPEEMLGVPLVEQVARAGSIEKFVVDGFHPADELERRGLCNYVCDLFTRARHKTDFAYWCASLVKIAPKAGGADILFTLNGPQRRLAGIYEEQRLSGRPIRVIITKARQWGGSTVTQIYMAWHQLVRETGLNSLIISHVLSTSEGIKAMFRRLLGNYPIEYLYPAGASFKAAEAKLRPLGSSRNISVVPQRNCRIQIGTALEPDSCRGLNHTLLHESETAQWKTTDGKRPEEIARAAEAGILYEPNTIIVKESTARRSKDYFHSEWLAATRGESQYAPVFVGCHEIEQYRLRLTDGERARRAERLFAQRGNKNVKSDREESGEYYWWLWEKGATLGHIAWYEQERKKYTSHDEMATEFPVTAEEAFANVQTAVFTASSVDRLRATCKPPQETGEVYGKTVEGEECIKGLRFVPDGNGALAVWDFPEKDEGDIVIKNRYLTVVDVGRGVSDKADYSVICVFDRLMTVDGGKPVVAAQWRGRTDIDLLAWKAVQVAAWYNDSLLVIESNTIESNGGVGGNMSEGSYYVLELIADFYPNLYYREQSAEDIVKHAPRKIGFHTNRKTKAACVNALRKAVRERGYVERDGGALDEFLTYEQLPSGAFAAAAGEHDDRLMTRAIGLYICMDERKMEPVQIVSASGGESGVYAPPVLGESSF